MAPGRARIICGERACDAAVFDSRVKQAASGFATLGVGAGSAVALFLRNDIAFLEAASALALLGAYPVAMNWHATTAEAAYILADCGARLIVVHTDLLARITGALPPGITVLPVETPAEINRAFGLKADHAAANEGPVWDDWLESHPQWPHPPREAPGAIIYTSGTSGHPKGVKRAIPTAEQAAAAARLVAQAYGLAPRDERIVSLVTAPLYHSAPNMHAMTSLRVGADIVIQARFDPEETLALIARHRVTHAYFAPIMFNRLLQLSETARGRYDLTSLEFVVHAAAPCPPAVKRAMIDWWGPVIHEFYGSTEARAVTGSSAQEWLERPGTVGRPLAGAIVRVIDAEGRDVAPFERGEICCGHPGLADFTYHGDDAKRAAIDREGLIATGDIGFLDEEGYLFLCDRTIDMVISGGVNIYPAEIEAELCRLPGVKDCAVFGIPDDEFGEALMAVVESIDGLPLDVDALQAALRDRLSGYKVPRQIEQRDSLPREDSGKLFKRKLREPYWAKAQRQI